MNYPNNAYYQRGYKDGFWVGVEYQRRFTVAAKQFAKASGAGVHMAMMRGSVPMEEIEPPATEDQDRIDELHHMVWSSVVTL